MNAGNGGSGGGGLNGPSSVGNGNSSNGSSGGNNTSSTGNGASGGGGGGNNAGGGGGGTNSADGLHRNGGNGNSSCHEAGIGSLQNTADSKLWYLAQKPEQNPKNIQTYAKANDKLSILYLICGQGFNMIMQQMWKRAVLRFLVIIIVGRSLFCEIFVG